MDENKQYFKKLILEDNTVAWVKDEDARNSIVELNSNIETQLADKISTADFNDRIGAQVQVAMAAYGSGISNLTNIIKTETVEDATMTSIQNSSDDASLLLKLTDDTINIVDTTTEDIVASFTSDDVKLPNVDSTEHFNIEACNTDSTITEVFIGDGINKTFTLSQPVKTFGSVMINDENLPASSYTRDNNVINIKDNIPAPTSKVKITYTPALLLYNYTIGQRDNSENGIESLVIGNQNAATGVYALAAGSGTKASGFNSTAIGYKTEAKGENQFVFGQQNIVDNNNEYIEIVGNGGYKAKNVTEDQFVNNVTNKITLDNPPISINTIYYDTNGYDIVGIRGIHYYKANGDEITSIAKNSTEIIDKIVILTDYPITQDLPIIFKVQADGIFEGSTDDISINIKTDTNDGNDFVQQDGTNYYVNTTTGLNHSLTVPNNGNTRNISNDSTVRTGTLGGLTNKDYEFTPGNNDIEAKGALLAYNPHITSFKVHVNYTYNERGENSNARTLDWDGNEQIAGNLTVGNDLIVNGKFNGLFSGTECKSTTIDGNDGTKIYLYRFGPWVCCYAKDFKHTGSSNVAQNGYLPEIIPEDYQPLVDTAFTLGTILGKVNAAGTTSNGDNAGKIKVSAAWSTTAAKSFSGMWITDGAIEE